MMRFAVLVQVALVAILLTFVVSSQGCADTKRDAQTLDLSAVKVMDLAGTTHRLGTLTSHKAVAFVFLSNECPVSNQYLPELNRISERFAAAPVAIFGVLPDPLVSRAVGQEYAKEYDIQFPVLFDATGELRDVMRPTHVPEAFVIGAGGVVLYRGRIDNLYADNFQRRPQATSHELIDALESAADGESPAVAYADPVGCRLPSNQTQGADAEITFTRHIAPILYANCTECHRPGEVAPFPLQTYEDAAKRADFLADVVELRRMPPWLARPDFGHFEGERRLSAREKKILRAWADAGAPEGKPEDLPPVPEFREGWRLGTPDLIVKMAEPFTVPAGGPDLNRFFVIPIETPEDKYVVGVEFQAGNPNVCHHAIMYTDRSGTARKRDEATPEPGYNGFIPTGLNGGVLGFWAPGYTPRFYPQGAGQKLQPETDMALQIHYHPSGKEEIDQSMVGIYFADKPVEHTLGGLTMIDFDVDVPAGESRHKMAHSFTTPVDLEIVDIVPHMHYIGKEMKITATLPDGTVLPLIWVDWDFNWQDVYHFQEAVKVPAGTRFDLEAYFDNSEANPYNPYSPPQRIVFGEETTDEMCICAFRTIDNASEVDRKALRDAFQNDILHQMQDPDVFLSVMRFMQEGRRIATSDAKSDE